MRLIHFGEMAERSIAAVLKTVDPQGSGGSNPSLSAMVFDLENRTRTLSNSQHCNTYSVGQDRTSGVD